MNNIIFDYLLYYCNYYIYIIYILLFQKTKIIRLEKLSIQIIAPGASVYSSNKDRLWTLQMIPTEKHIDECVNNI